MDCDPALAARQPTESIQHQVAVGAGDHLVHGLVQKTAGGEPHHLAARLTVLRRSRHVERSRRVPVRLSNGFGVVGICFGIGAGGSGQQRVHRDILRHFVQHRDGVGQRCEHIAAAVHQRLSDVMALDIGQQIIRIAAQKAVLVIFNDDAVPRAHAVFRQQRRQVGHGFRAVITVVRHQEQAAAARQIGAQALGLLGGNILCGRIQHHSRRILRHCVRRQQRKRFKAHVLALSAVRERGGKPGFAVTGQGVQQRRFLAGHIGKRARQGSLPVKFRIIGISLVVGRIGVQVSCVHHTVAFTAHRDDTAHRGVRRIIRRAEGGIKHGVFLHHLDVG